MKEGPDFSRVAALIGDPARANILNALLSGKALTAGELAFEAGVSATTASSHLTQLAEAGLIWPRKQGRHRYYALKGEEVAATLETLACLAVSKGHTRAKTGPKDESLREARICYDHLAGRKATQIFESLVKRDFLTVDFENVALTETGQNFMENLGVDVDALKQKRRPLCKVCLDWSERRSHLSGALGAAIFSQFEERKWLSRDDKGRSIIFTPKGLQVFEENFRV